MSEKPFIRDRVKPTHVLRVDVPLDLSDPPYDYDAVQDALRLVLSISRVAGHICDDPQVTAIENPSAWPELDHLFEAFVAGFEISAEGYNGEWMSPSRYPTPEAVKAKMVEEFTAWRNHTAARSPGRGSMAETVRPSGPNPPSPEVS